MTDLYEKYYEYFLRMNSPTDAAFESVASAYSALYQQYLPVDKNAKILDVGCGMGHFLYFLEKQGYTNYWGIDLSASQTQFVRGHITERVTVADAFNYLTTNGPFDVIAANDILEHIPKAKMLNFLTLVYYSLGPNGLLLVKTPNMSNPFGLRYRYIDFTHNMGFTEESLRFLLSIAGFQDIHITGESSVIHSFKSRLGMLRKRAVHMILAQLFKAQNYVSPSILDPNLIAICKRI